MSAAVARMPQVAWRRQDQSVPSQMGGQPAIGVSALVDPRQKKGVSSAAVRKPTVTVPVSSLAFYRRYTELMLRRYMQLSMRMGKVPSVLGSCMFRGRVSSRQMHSFEDTVAFVLDVERCMRTLDPEDRELIARIALQEYTQAEAARLTGQSLRTVVRKYGEAIDGLTRLFLEKDLLEVGPLYEGQ